MCVRVWVLFLSVTLLHLSSLNHKWRTLMEVGLLCEATFLMSMTRLVQLIPGFIHLQPVLLTIIRALDLVLLKMGGPLLHFFRPRAPPPTSQSSPPIPPSILIPLPQVVRHIRGMWASISARLPCLTSALAGLLSCS
jgi:hypothetical protein